MHTSPRGRAARASARTSATSPRRCRAAAPSWSAALPSCSRHARAGLKGGGIAASVSTTMSYPGAHQHHGHADEAKDVLALVGE